MAHNGATLITHATDFALTRLAGSEPLPYFLPVDGYTRLHLSYSGSFGPQFPTFPVSSHRPSVLRSAKTANSPSRWRSLFAIPHRYLACPLRFVSPASRLDSSKRWDDLFERLGFFGYGHPNTVALARRPLALPSSRVTPMNTGPGLRPRW